MIKMAKKKGNAPFYVAVRRCLSNPFTPPVYIEGRNGGCLNDIDCLKVGHHGSGYSSSEEFLKKVKPELSIISCSSTNTYGHPSPETVKRLKDCGSQIEYTMKNGAIILETNGKNLRIRRFCGN